MSILEMKKRNKLASYAKEIQFAIFFLPFGSIRAKKNAGN
jgi:hypothetical protein